MRPGINTTPLPNCSPLFLGSMPGNDHLEALQLTLQYSSDYPTWPQLPENEQESILQQFLPGLPGIHRQKDSTYDIDYSSKSLQDEIIMFWKEYESVQNGLCDYEQSRFALTQKSANGLYTLLNYFKRHNTTTCTQVKGHTIGPITFCTCLRDAQGSLIYNNEELRECAITLIATKAKWQARMLSQIKENPIIFFDEPMLMSLNKPNFPIISKNTLLSTYEEVFKGVQDEGGMLGIHVCADTDWGVVLESNIDILSLDSYSFFDGLLKHPKEVMEFIDKGGLIASGIVPTAPDLLGKETCSSLVEKYLYQASKLEEIGLQKRQVLSQSYITPSCGTGRLNQEQAISVMELTNNVATALKGILNGLHNH